MLRVLTLSSLFPDASRPDFGVFVEQQTLALAARSDVELRVVAPRPIHRGYHANITVPFRESWKALDVYRPNFLSFPIVGGRLNAASMARTLRPLLRAIRRDFPFDVVDAQFFWPDGAAAARLGYPFSIKARGADIHHWGRRRDSGPQIVAAAHKADGLLAVSAALRDDMAAIGIPAERTRVHYTGVDLDRFTPADRSAAKAALGLTGPVIATLGALIERKGQALVIEALNALPGVTLLIVGGGPMRAAYEAQAKPLGDRVRFMGPQPHAALPALLAAADAMVLPSASEGLANAWVEALACGAPIVIADVGGARELLRDESAGRIVARTPRAISEAVQALLAAPPDRATVRHAAERFTWTANSDALFDHLSAIAAKARAQARVEATLACHPGAP
jgi:glycosyltransferase involved in cell wall biosynthesis